MSAAKHTPGTWEVLDGRRVGVTLSSKVEGCGFDSHCIALTHSDRDEIDAEANARLIAAAPDLLAVAEFFLRGIEGGHIRCAPYIDLDPNAETLEIKSPAARLREAIAKATGGAQ